MSFAIFYIIYKCQYRHTLISWGKDKMEEQNSNGDKEKKENKFSVNPIVLLRDFKDLFGMFFAAIRGKFKIRLSSIVWALLGAFYFLLPLDLVPEALYAFLGLGDDLLFLVYILNQIRPDIERYRQFKLENKRKNNEKNL